MVGKRLGRYAAGGTVGKFGRQEPEDGFRYSVNSLLVQGGEAMVDGDKAKYIKATKIRQGASKRYHQQRKFRGSLANVA